MNTTDHFIHVLLIEDNPGDVRLIREMLQETKGRKITLEHCATLTQGLQALLKNDFNILLLDLTLPDSTGFDTFVKVYTQNPQIPIVVLTGTNDEELAIKSVHTGAQDYLIKGQIDSSLLSRSISYAIERASLLRVVQQELIERKAMESMLRKINRALRVLSECNQIVVRATEENVLAEKICGAITAVGEYQFAWIAFTESDDSKSIQPIAIVGSKDGNSPVEASAWFNRDPDSPLSEALKTGKVVVCNDVTIDKRCSNLKTEADKLGYRSFVILPLAAEGRILGVVQICSKEPDRFDLEELKLLDELKEDVAYAIVSIRTEKERRRGEEEIKMLARFPSENPSPILRINQDGTILNTNEASSALLQNWDCSLGDCVPTFWREVIREVLTTLERKTIEIKLGERTFSFLVVPISEAGYVNLYGLDITERKQAEETLRKSEEKWRSLVSTMPDYVSLLDTEGRFLFLNHYAEGFEERDIIGKSVLEYISKESLEIFKKGIEDALNTKKTQKFEHTAMGDNGDWRNYEDYLVPINEKDKVINILVISRDITERKLAEEALRESETRYRSVLQSATDAIVTVDGSGIIIGWNSAAERNFGYSFTEAVGQSLTSIVSLYPFDEHTNGMKGIQSEGGQSVVGKTGEFKGFRKDKSEFPIELSLSSWETKSGQFFTGIIRDITERKQAEEKILHQLEELRRWQDVTLGREDRNRQLKHEVNELLIRLGVTIRYPSQESDTHKDKTNEVL